jgi:uncharacterized membrane protein
MAMEQAGQHLEASEAGYTPPAPRERESDHSAQDGGFMNFDEERLATALGWFSIGLGLAQVAAPGGVARLIGVRDDDQNCRMIRAVGLRELASGVGILSRPRPAGWVWARVGGDVMDLALLGAALTSDDTRKDRLTAATAAVAGVTILDLLCGERLSNRAAAETGSAVTEWTGRAKDRIIRIRKAITIGRAAEELYRFWRDFENLPRVMTHLESVRVTGERRSHWKAKAPLGFRVTWDAEIVEDQPNERIAWRSLEGAGVKNAGSVTFEPAPGGRGTTVRVDLQYEPPGGVIGATLAKLFGEEPGQQVQEDLRAFKQVMETGEMVRSEGSLRTRHPARPAATRT